MLSDLLNKFQLGGGVRGRAVFGLLIRYTLSTLTHVVQNWHNDIHDLQCEIYSTVSSAWAATFCATSVSFRILARYQLLSSSFVQFTSQ